MLMLALLASLRNLQRPCWRDLDVVDDAWLAVQRTDFPSEVFFALSACLSYIGEIHEWKVITNEDRKRIPCMANVAHAVKPVALIHFSGMVTRPAKTVEATSSMITEMERQIKMVEDVTRMAARENHAKPLLVGILDPASTQPIVLAWKR